MKKLIFYTLLILNNLLAEPKYYVLLRHAEKNHDSDINNLSSKGKLRAQAIAALFEKPNEFTGCFSQFIRQIKNNVASIYSFAPNGKYPTIRAIETVQPLANSLKLEIDARYNINNLKELVEEIKTNPKNNEKTVIICASRTKLAKVANLIGTNIKIKDTDAFTFDRILLIKRDIQKYKFINLPQELIFGDSSEITGDISLKNEICPKHQKNKFALKVELKSNGYIQTKSTCQGKNQIPNMKFINVPKTTKSLALIIDDPDAPQGTVDHLLAYNIPVETDFIDKNSDLTAFGLLKNYYDKLGYIGPCPPKGQTHRYFFKLYALKRPISEKITTKEELEKAMKEKLIAKAETIGHYQKIELPCSTATTAATSTGSTT
jgi:Raf kinase inhibitor-like YbhB/YbcL family protein